VSEEKKEMLLRKAVEGRFNLLLQKASNSKDLPELNTALE